MLPSNANTSSDWPSAPTDCLLSNSTPQCFDVMVVSVALPVARQTNNRKVVGSMPANIACITAHR